MSSGNIIWSTDPEAVVALFRSTSSAPDSSTNTVPVESAEDEVYEDDYEVSPGKSIDGRSGTYSNKGSPTPKATPTHFIDRIPHANITPDKNTDDISDILKMKAFSLYHEAKNAHFILLLW